MKIQQGMSIKKIKNKIKSFKLNSNDMSLQIGGQHALISCLTETDILHPTHKITVQFIAFKTLTKHSLFFRSFIHSFVAHVQTYRL